MAASVQSYSRKRRKLEEQASVEQPSLPTKVVHKTNSRPAQGEPASASPFLAPHEAIISSLTPKYNLLCSSVISSTKIQKRVLATTTHLIPSPAPPAEGNPRMALLFARTADVYKLITIVELVTRALSQEGTPWFQYNQLFDQPEKERLGGIVEETVLSQGVEGGKVDNETDDDEDDDAAFEPVKTRFEEAMMPPPPSKLVKSLRIFISTERVIEMEGVRGVTLQSSEESSR